MGSFVHIEARVQLVRTRQGCAFVNRKEHTRCRGRRGAADGSQQTCACIGPSMARKSKREKIEKHKQSLGDVLEDPESYGVRTRPRTKQKHRERDGSGDVSDDDDRAGEGLPSDLTNKIMREAHLQQEEMKRDSNQTHREAYKDSLAGAIHNLQGDVQGLESEDELGDGWSDGDVDDRLEAEWEQEVDAEDEAVLAAFMNKAEGKQTRTLADIIMEKIREKEAGGGQGAVRYDGRGHPLAPWC